MVDGYDLSGHVQTANMFGEDEEGATQIPGFVPRPCSKTPGLSKLIGFPYMYIRGTSRSQQGIA